MSPGQGTQIHTHDDDDERLSAVYYVTAPPGSGDLILESQTGAYTLSPRAGRLVCFPPDMPHAVSKNLSQQMRLSVGLNFGPVRQS